MAVNDILVRLLMDANGYNRDLSRSEQKTKDFEKNIRSNINKAASSFTKLAGAVGIGVTAFEAFDKAINSNQKMADAASATLKALQHATDSFFYSVTTGDFTPLFSGLDSLITKAREAANAMDQLGNTRMSFAYFSGMDQEAIAEYAALAGTAGADPAKVEAARVKAEAAIKRQGEAVQVLAQDTQDAMRKIVAATAGIDESFITMSGLEDTFLIDISANRGQIKEQMEGEFKAFQKEAGQIAQRFTTRTSYNSITGAGSQIFFDSEGYAKEINKIIPKYKQSIVYQALLNNMSDEQLQNVMQLGTAYYQAKQGLASLQKQFNRAGKSSASGSVSTAAAPKTPAIVEAFAEGSIGSINQKISALQKELEKATDDGTRIGIQKGINELIAQRGRIEKYTEMMAAGVTVPKAIPGTELNLPDFKKIEPVISKSSVQTNLEFADSIQAIGSAMSSLSSMTGEGAAAWLQWGNNVASSIAAALPQIQTLIAAKTAEGAVSAGASAAQTPLVGWLLAGGAIAAFLAAVASIPKFAEGGIVGGSSFVGDKNLARLNSGEMVLTRGQQARLFDMIDKGGGLGGQVEFKIKGQELQGVLQNYNNKRSKVR